MKKYIGIIKLEETPTHVWFKIDKQTHKEDEFGNDFNIFRASNDVELHSCGTPEVAMTSENIFYVRGDSGQDNRLLSCTKLIFDLIMVAINEYNTFFSESIYHYCNPLCPKCMENPREVVLF